MQKKNNRNISFKKRYYKKNNNFFKKKKLKIKTIKKNRNRLRRTKKKKMVGGNSPILTPPDLIPLEAMHDHLLTRADFMSSKHYFPSVLNKLLKIPLKEMSRTMPNENNILSFYKNNSFFNNYKLLSDNSFIKLLTGYTKTQFRNTLYTRTKNLRVGSTFFKPWERPIPNYYGVNRSGVKYPEHNYLMACETKENFDFLIKETIKVLQKNTDSLHLYFVSDAAHHIFRYIKDKYIHAFGEKELPIINIHPVISIETLSDPSSPFHEESNSFKSLAEVPNHKVNFLMIEDKRSKNVTNNWDDLLQTKAKLELTKNSNNKMVTQIWENTYDTNYNLLAQIDDPPQPNNIIYNCSENTGKVYVKQRIDQINSSDIDEKLYHKLYRAQPKRMGDYGQICLTEELPKLISNWNINKNNITLLKPNNKNNQKTIINSNKFNWEQGKSESDIKKRVFHVTGGFPAFGCAISRGLNSIIMIPNTPHIIVALNNN